MSGGALMNAGTEFYDGANFLLLSLFLPLEYCPSFMRLLPKKIVSVLFKEPCALATYLSLSNKESQSKCLCRKRNLASLRDFYPSTRIQRLCMSITHNKIHRPLQHAPSVPTRQRYQTLHQR